MARQSSNVASTINLLAGIWLIISPFVLNYSNLGAGATNAVVVGIVVAILALIKMANPEATWASWINFLLGLWMIVAPFARGFGSVGTVVGNEVILGIIIAVVAITNALSTSRMQMQT